MYRNWHHWRVVVQRMRTCASYTSELARVYTSGTFLLSASVVPVSPLLLLLLSVRIHARLHYVCRDSANCIHVHHIHRETVIRRSRAAARRSRAARATKAESWKLSKTTERKKKRESERARRSVTTRDWDLNQFRLRSLSIGCLRVPVVWWAARRKGEVGRIDDSDQWVSVRDEVSDKKWEVDRAIQRDVAVIKDNRNRELRGRKDTILWEMTATVGRSAVEKETMRATVATTTGRFQQRTWIDDDTAVRHTVS